MDTVKLSALAVTTIGVVLWAGVIGVLMFPSAPGAGGSESLVPTRVFTVYAVEHGSKFGFSLDAKNLTSVDTPIRVKVGDVVRITLHNLGKLPHSFAVITTAQSSAPLAFSGASIGSGAEPIFPNEERTIVFKVDKPGRFSYACTVPGHIQLGMHGEFIVEP